MPREESFPIPRATSTTLDVMLERRIDDYWKIEGDRDLSDSWSGFTRFTVLDEKPPDWYTWSWGRLTKKPTTSRPDCLWPEIWKICQTQRNAKKNKSGLSKNQSSIILEKLRGIRFIDPTDAEFKETIKTRGKSWKFRWKQPRFARSGKERTRKLVAILMLRRQNVHASLKPTIL